MRIIAGQARGRTLFAPKGQHTRPTQDFVRESLFNIIQRHVPESVVLDLFAGSGALALEALSRGAAKAVLADCSRQAIACIRRNTDAAGFTDRASILQCDWRVAVDKLKNTGIRFNLVFLDPPYELTLYPEITDLLRDRGLLAVGALIVVEHRKDVRFDLSPSFVSKDLRTYGDTGIRLYTYQQGGSSDGE